MLQALLAERFALRVHRSTRQGQVHALVVARPDGRFGPSLRRTSAACAAEMEAVRRALQEARAAPLPNPGGPLCGGGYEKRGVRPSDVTAVNYGVPIAKIVDDVVRELNAPVVDRTGLTGWFDYTLEFETSRLLPQTLGAPTIESTEPPRPPLRYALEQQLGLKLQTTTGAIPIVVIDAVQRPTPD